MLIIHNKLLYEKEKTIARYNRLSQKLMRQPVVLSMDETIAAIRDRRASIARYGDGEFDIIFGRSQGFQQQDRILAKRLKEILRFNCVSDRFLVGLPNCFGDLHQFIPEAQLHWRLRLERERAHWVHCLNTRAPYYNSQITRFYFDWADKMRCQGWFEGLKRIWNGESILLVEGDKSRVGVRNDLFDNAVSVRRVLCPSENAFDRYEEILMVIQRYANQSDLIFMALGPTATVLAYDLFRLGYWAFDAGHIDLEYEWMKAGATEKTKIAGKYVNEVKNGSYVEEVNDARYLSEIVARVGC